MRSSSLGEEVGGKGCRGAENRGAALESGRKGEREGEKEAPAPPSRPACCCRCCVPLMMRLAPAARIPTLLFQPPLLPTPAFWMLASWEERRSRSRGTRDGGGSMSPRAGAESEGGGGAGPWSRSRSSEEATAEWGAREGPREAFAACVDWQRSLPHSLGSTLPPWLASGSSPLAGARRAPALKPLPPAAAAPAETAWGAEGGVSLEAWARRRGLPASSGGGGGEGTRGWGCAHPAASASAATKFSSLYGWRKRREDGAGKARPA